MKVLVPRKTRYSSKIFTVNAFIFNFAESVQKDNKIFLFIIVFTILVFLCILLIIALILYRRKNLYGGFYIITTRPIADNIVNYDGEETSIKPGISK